MKTLKIALDWTPNINHLGIFVAKELGFYSDHGINLEILNPFDDNYDKTPGKKLELGIADFAIAPFETVISLNNKTNKVDAVAIFALLQEDLSSIASLKSKNLNSPKFQDNKTYASYKARYEDKIVKELVKNDGGKGEFKIIYPEKLGIWNTLLEGNADSTWIFDNWEGVEANCKNIELNKWSLKDYDIPYGYSPVILTKRESIQKNEILFSKFIAATKEAYTFFQKDSDTSLKILSKHLTDYDKENIDIKKAYYATKAFYGQEENIGKMNSMRVELFLNWLVEHNLESPVIKNQKLFTNEFLM